MTVKQLRRRTAVGVIVAVCAAIATALIYWVVVVPMIDHPTYYLASLGACVGAVYAFIWALEELERQ
jgi:hypothetical protein